MKSINKKKNKNRIMAFVNIASLAFLVIVLVSSIVTFGKYYSQQRQKGVAMASDFYFSSDILAKGVTVNENGPVSGFAEYAMSGRWNKTGTTSSFTFNIRNFENNLLYNGSNVDVKYNVYFMLEKEETNGATCSVRDAEGNSVVVTTGVNSMEHNGSIKEYSLNGGSAQTDTFTVTYEHPTNSNYPVGLYIWVVPTSPSYISKNNYTLGSKIKMTESVESFSLTGKFDISDILTGNETDDNNVLKNQSGFVYKVATTGSYDNDQVSIKLTWNSNYLTIDKFSSIIADQDGLNPDEDGNITITTTMKTFSSMDLIFYKTDAFNNKTWTKADFENLVSLSLNGSGN